MSRNYAALSTAPQKPTLTACSMRNSTPTVKKSSVKYVQSSPAYKLTTTQITTNFHQYPLLLLSRTISVPSSFTIAAIVFMFISVVAEEVRPQYGINSVDVLPTFNFLSWLYTYHFSHFDMFVHYFARLQTNHYTLLTISPISFIFDSARNLMRNVPYHPL